MTDDLKELVARLRTPGTWAKHEADIIASDAVERLRRDDSPFEAADAIERLEARVAELEAMCVYAGPEDEPLPEDKQIIAAHPANNKANHAAFEEAVRMVSAKRSKYALVGLVTWLLAERDAAKAENARLREALEAVEPFVEADFETTTFDDTPNRELEAAYNKMRAALNGEAQ